MNKLTLLKNGIIKENPVLILLLGTCPTLAVTTSAINGPVSYTHLVNINSIVLMK